MKVAVVLGTKPEITKLAPVVKLLNVKASTTSLFERRLYD